MHVFLQMACTIGEKIGRNDVGPVFLHLIVMKRRRGGYSAGIFLLCGWAISSAFRWAKKKWIGGGIGGLSVMCKGL